MKWIPIALGISLIGGTAVAQETNQAAPCDPRLYPDPTFSEITPPEKAHFEMKPRPTPEEKTSFRTISSTLSTLASRGHRKGWTATIPT